MNLQRQRQFAQQYANTSVETSVSEATPHKLVEMLYEGVVKNLKLSKIFIDQKNFEKKTEHMNKSLAILLHLREMLDVEKGGEVAENLYALYDYCYRRVLSASIENNNEMVDEVIEHIEGLSSSWKEMPDNFKALSKSQLEKVGGH